jgi:chorismate mutase
MPDPGSHAAPGAIPQALKDFRKSIDNLDATLIHVLAERFRLTQRVGEFKRDHDLPSSDPGREKRQIARLKRLAVEADLDPEFAERFIRFVIDEVIRHHDRIRRGAE